MLSLHLAVVHKAPIRVLKEIVACCPQLREMPGYDGETPLHIACRSNILLPEVVEVLMSAEAAQSKDIYGNLPLHTYLKRSIHFDGRTKLMVIQFLISGYEDSILTFDKEGYTPLHRVCMQSSPTAALSVIQFMVNACPSSVTEVDGAGRLPVHLLCKSMEGASQSLHFLVNTCPASLYATDDKGRTPLHCACERSTYGRGEDEVIQALQFLVNVCPECADLQDSEGRTPLHILCDSGQREDLPFLKFLVDRFPEILKITDHSGYSPLHTSCDSHAHYDVVGFLAQKCPEVLHLVGGELSETPLLIVCRSYGTACCDSTDCNFYGCQGCFRVFRELCEFWQHQNQLLGRLTLVTVRQHYTSSLSRVHQHLISKCCLRNALKRRP